MFWLLSKSQHIIFWVCGLDFWKEITFSTNERKLRSSEGNLASAYTRCRGSGYLLHRRYIRSGVLSNTRNHTLLKPFEWHTIWCTFQFKIFELPHAPSSVAYIFVSKFAPPPKKIIFSLFFSYTHSFPTQWAGVRL